MLKILNKNIKKTDNSPFEKMAKPAQRALSNAGITSLEKLSEITEIDFMQLHGIGKNAVQIINAMMAELNLQFAANDQQAGKVR